MLNKIEKGKTNHIKIFKISLILFSFLICAVTVVTMSRVGEIAKEKSSITESEFSGNCGIIAGAESFRDSNDLLKIHITVKNISTKNISEIKIYVNISDSSDEILKGDFILYDDNKIMPNETKIITRTFSGKEIEKVELFIYNVRFEDGTQWGDMDADKSEILEKSYKINVVGVR